jgi:hypothetical protein
MCGFKVPASRELTFVDKPVEKSIVNNFTAPLFLPL